MPDHEIRRANVADLDLIVPLFDAYRRFYRKTGDMEGAMRFLRERLVRDESVILLSFEAAAAVGFTQLYPSFSSASMARIFVLNDLFVAHEARGRGIGSALLTAAAEFGRTAGAVRLVLSTEAGNTRAQSVYERLGWKRDMAFYTYQLAFE